MVARLLNRFTKAFSVVVSTLVELLTDGIGDLGGARGVGVVNGLCVLRDPNPVNSTASPDVVKGASVLRPRLLPRGMNGLRFGKSKLIRFKPLNLLLPRPA